MHWNTCRVNLYVRRVSEHSALTVALNSCCTVTSHSVGREEVSVSVTTSSDYYSVCREALELAGNEVLGDDTASTAVDDYYIFHLIAGKELYLASVNLAHE